MLFNRFLMTGILIVFTTAAFAEEWEEVFSQNTTKSKFYFDKNIVRVGADAVQTQYKILEPEPRPVSKSRPDSPSYDTAIYRAVINCKNYGWKFLHRAYYLNDKVQFEEDPSGGPTPAPPKGSAPFNVGEKSCALRR